MRSGRTIDAILQRIRQTEAAILHHKLAAAHLVDPQLVATSDRTLATMESTLDIEMKTHRLLVTLAMRTPDAAGETESGAP